MKSNLFESVLREERTIDQMENTLSDKPADQRHAAFRRKYLAKNGVKIGSRKDNRGLFGTYPDGETVSYVSDQPKHEQNKEIFNKADGAASKSRFNQTINIGKAKPANYSTKTAKDFKKGWEWADKVGIPQELSRKYYFITYDYRKDGCSSNAEFVVDYYNFGNESVPLKLDCDWCVDVMTKNKKYLASFLYDAYPPVGRVGVVQTYYSAATYWDPEESAGYFSNPYWELEELTYELECLTDEDDGESDDYYEDFDEICRYLNSYLEKCAEDDLGGLDGEDWS